MNKLYAIRQTGKSNYWYDFVEDFTSSELDRNCISNNFTCVKDCQNILGDLNPAWKNSEIVEFIEFGGKDDFEDLYYKSLEQRADLEAKLKESERRNKQLAEALNGEVFINYKIPMENAKLKQQLAEKQKELEMLKLDYGFVTKQYNELIEKGNYIINQDKISFAVEKLSDVRSFISDATEIKEPDYTKVCNYVDNQIKQLKEGK